MVDRLVNVSRKSSVSDDRQTQRKNHLRKLWWVLTGTIFVFGLFVIDLDTWKWFVVTIFVYSIPLIFQFSRSTVMRVVGIWFGIFLILQTLCSPLVSGDYRHLRPKLNLLYDPGAASSEGINGVQSITTDDLGFRTTKNIEYEKENTYRVFAIGGSTTEQLKIDDHKIWTHLLQEKLRRTLNTEVDVINTGLSGLRASNHYATLTRIINFHPDLVIVYSSGLMIGIGMLSSISKQKRQ